MIGGGKCFNTLSSGVHCMSSDESPCFMKFDVRTSVLLKVEASGMSRHINWQTVTEVPNDPIAFGLLRL
jgi:hypothetical protein